LRNLCAEIATTNTDFVSLPPDGDLLVSVIPEHSVQLELKQKVNVLKYQEK